MIALNETEEYAAEVPFFLPLLSDPLTGLTGHAFVLGQVKIQLPGSAVFVDVALNKIFEIGHGWFVVRLTAGQTTASGQVKIYAAVSGTQPHAGVETISTLGGEIAVNGSGYLIGYLPDAIDPMTNPPASGDFADLTNPVARVRWPDSTFQDFDVDDVVEIGNGMFGIPVTTLDTTKRGKAFCYLSADDYQPFSSYTTILGVSAATVVTPTPAPDPIESPVAESDDAFIDHVEAAIGRLCQYAKGEEAA